MPDVVYMSSTSVYGVVLNHNNNVSLTVFAFIRLWGHHEIKSEVSLPKQKC